MRIRASILSLINFISLYSKLYLNFLIDILRLFIKIYIKLYDSINIILEALITFYIEVTLANNKNLKYSSNI